MARVTTPRAADTSGGSRRAPLAKHSVPAAAKAPRRKTPQRGWLLTTTALLPIAAGPVLAQTMPAPNTGPTGGQVVAGQAAIAQGGNTTTITQTTGRAAIDWQQFNVGSQHTVQFVQPNQSSWTLNRVTTPDPSVIAGRIQANGGVAIINQAGMLFADGAQVNVASLIASASGVTNENFMAGRMVFDQPARQGARVENRGSITVADRGLATLVAPGVANSGVIRARLGRVALGAAETFVLDLAGDGLIGIDVTQAVRTAPEGGAALVTNTGVIEAHGGSVLITAHAASGLVEDLVRQSGTVDVRTAEGRTGQAALRAQGGNLRVDGTIDATGGADQRGGSVALQATGGVTVAGTARVDASGGTGGGRVLVGTTGRGRNQTMAARTTVEAGAVIRADATRNGNAGEIVVNSTQRTEMRGTLTARGGAEGGNGGFVEVSGQGVFVLDGIVDLRAPAGAMGEFLLDPQNIIISADANPTLPGTGEVAETPPDLDTPGGSVTEAGRVVAASAEGDDWVRIAPETLENFAAGNITLEANRQIIIDDAVNRTNAGDLTLRAGLAGAATGADITQRAGADITINGVLTLDTQRGAISLGADIRSTGLTLAASGGITQSAGTIAHLAGADSTLTLQATSATGGISLDQVGNGALAATFSAAGDVAIRSGGLGTGVDGALTIAGPSNGGSVLLAVERAAIDSTGGTLAINDSVTSLAGITLHVDGAVTQGADGALITAADATGVLRLRDSGGTLGAESAVLTAAGNRISVLDAVTTGALAVTSAGHVGSPTMTVSQAEGASVTLTAPRLALPNGAAATTGDVMLVATEAGGGSGSAATLTIGGAVTAGTDQAVRLRADRMDLAGASFSAATGNLATLEVGSQMAGRSLLWGGADGNGLHIAAPGATAITGTDAATLRLGQTTVDGGTVTAGGVEFRDGLTFAGTLALHATGTISQAGGVIDVPTLVVRGDDADAAAGGISLSSANLVDSVDLRSDSDIVLYSYAPTLTVLAASGTNVRIHAEIGALALGPTAISAGATLSLWAGTDLTQSTGAISAATLVARAGGNLSLTHADNAIASIGSAAMAPNNGPLLTNTDRGIYAGGTVALATSGALTIGGAVESRGGLVDITAGSLAINAPIAVSGGGTPTLRLTTNGSGGANGNMAQTARILTDALAVTASGNAILTATGNAVSRLQASSAGGSFSLFTTAAMTVAGAVDAATGVSLQSNGALTVTAEITTQNLRTIALTGSSITQAALIRAGDAIGPATGTVQLTAGAGGITQVAGGRIVAQNLQLSASGAVNLRAGLALGGGGDPSDWNAVRTLAGTVTGSFSLLNAGDLTYSGSVSGGTAATLVTTGGLILSGGSAFRGTTTALAAGGSIDIRGSLGGAGTNTVTLATGTGGTISQTGAGLITSGALRIIAGGDVTLDAAGNLVNGISAAALSADVGISFRSGGALTTLSALDSMLLPDNTFVATPNGVISNDVTLQAPMITLVGSVVRFDTNQVGSADFITDNLISAGGEIDLGDGGIFAISFENPNIEILVGDPVVDGHLPTESGTYTVISATPVTGETTQWISGAFINGLPLSANTTNATLRIGSSTQTARTFVIGSLTPDARFTTFDLRGGTVIIGADITVPGRTVTITAGTSVLSSGTYARNEQRMYFVGTDLLVPVSMPGVIHTQAGGVITAGALSVTAGSGVVDLAGASHNVGVLSGSAGTTFSFRNTNGFTVGAGGITAGTRIELRANTGNIAQAAGAAIITPQLAAHAAAGSIILDGGSASSSGDDLNHVGRLVGMTADNALTARDGFTLRNAHGFILGNNIQASSGTVSLHAQTGDITQATGSRIVAGGLRVSTPAGSVTLANGLANVTNTTADANEITNGIGDSLVAGNLTLRNQTAIGIVGDVLVGSAAGGTAGHTTLMARTGSITQSAAGSLATDTLTAVALQGSLLLNGSATNAIGGILDARVNSDIRLFNSHALTVANALTAPGAIELQAPGLTLAASLQASRVLLRTGADFLPAGGTAAGAGIIQTAGTIIASQFSASAPDGDIILNAAGNSFGTITAGANSNGAPVTAGIVAGGNVELTTSGTLTLNSPLLAGWDPARTDVTVRLTADNMALNALVDTRGPGSLDRQDGTIVIAPLTADRPIDLGGIIDSSNYLVLQSTELANLRAGTVTVTTTASGEAISIVGTASLVGSMTGGTTLNLFAAGGFIHQVDIGGSTSELMVERLNIVAGQYVHLGRTTNQIGEVTGLSAGGDITLASASPLLTLSGPVASTRNGGIITIRANDLAIPDGGSITVPNGTVDIAGVTAGRGISLGTELADTLGLSSAEIARIGETANPLALIRIGDAGSGTITLHGDVSFRDTPADATGAVGGERALALALAASTVSGDIVQTAGSLNIATVSASARTVSLVSPDNTVDAVAGLTAAGSFAALRSSRDLTLLAGATASAALGTVALTSDTNLLVEGTASGLDVALTGRTGLEISTTGVISATRDVTLTAAPASGAGIAALTIDGTVSATGSITGLSTGTLTVRQDMQAVNGNITLSTAAPGGQPPADIVIAAPTSGTANLAPGLAGTTELRASDGTISLTATGAVEQGAAGTQIIASSLEVASGQHVDLGVGGNQVVTLQSLSAEGAAAVSVAGALVVAGAVTATGDLSLASGVTVTVAATGSVEATGPGSTATLTGATGVTVAGSVTADHVELTATTGQAAVTGGTVTGGAGAGGSVTFNGGSVLVNGGAVVTADTVTAALATGPITISASTVSALSTLSLTTGGTMPTQGIVIVSGATIGGATMILGAGAGGLAISDTTLTAGAGGATLTSLGAAAITGGTSGVTGGSLSLTGATDASITGGTHAATGDVAVTGTAGTATIGGTGTVTAGANIILQGQTGASVTAGTHTAGGHAQITAANGAAEVLSAALTATAGTISLTGNTARIDTATVEAGGDVALTALAGTATIANGGVTAGADIVLQGTAGANVTGGTHAAGGGVQIVSDTGSAQILNTTLTATAGTVALAGTAAQINNATVNAGSAVTLHAATGAATIDNGTVTAGTDILLQGQTGATVTGGAHTAARDLTITTVTGTAAAVSTTLGATAGTLTIAGPAAAMNNATLTAGTAIAMTGGTVSTTGGVLASGGAISLEAGNGLATLTGTQTSAAGTTSITGQAGVQLNAGSHAAGAGFVLESAGGAAALSTTTLTTAAGAPVEVSARTVTITGGTIGAGGDMTLTALAGDLTLASPTLTAGGTLALQADAGSIVVQPGTNAQATMDIILSSGGLTITNASLTAGQDLLATIAGSASVADATLTVGQNLRLAAGGTLVARNSVITGNTVGLRAGGALTLDGGQYIIGEAVAFASPTSIATTPGTMLTVLPRGSLLPGVAFDTRATGSQPDPLDVIVADNPLLPAPQQTTQVRIPGTNSPGSFGPPDADPAGTLDFAINAGRSTIFLLIDGGDATGTIETAGRVGVVGLGGMVTLYGTLIDHNGNRLTGPTASALTDSARPGPSNQLTRFRFNGCVISSFNCFVPTQFVALPQAPPLNVDLRLWGSRITDPDVQIPNVAEEDY